MIPCRGRDELEKMERMEGRWSPLPSLLPSFLLTLRWARGSEGGKMGQWGEDGPRDKWFAAALVACQNDRPTDQPASSEDGARKSLV